MKTDILIEENEYENAICKIMAILFRPSGFVQA